MQDDAPPTLPSGSLIAARYQVLGLLGSGGMGSVYRVEHTGMAKQLALKLLRPEVSASPTVVERFEREARSAARLDHPSIVRITDFGKSDDGALFMVMELVDGCSLAERLAQVGPMTPDVALALISQVLEALAHAHGNDIVHRDIKPANIMLTVSDDGRTRAKLVDFGIAKITAPDGTESQLTQLGVVMGTPRYMSPEQAAGEAVDARTDLYSVGVVLYELLCGQAPFVGSSVDVMSKHLTQAPPPLLLTNVAPARAAAIEAVVARALAKRREDRFADAAAFLAAIAQCTATNAASSPGASLVRRAKLVHRQHPQLVRAALVIAAIVLIVAALGRGGARATSLVESGQAALARGDLPAARAIALEALTQDGAAARAYLLQAGIAMAEDHADTAVVSLRRAIELDRALVTDPWVETAVKSEVMHDTKTAPTFLALVVERGTGASAPLLAELSRTAPRSTLRKDAYGALERLGETERLDRLTWLTDELKSNARQSCTTRKWYVERLIALADPRTLPTLKKELARKGGFLNLSSESECMASELRAHIKELEPPKAE